MEADDQTPSRYPYLISVRGGGPRPARRDGTYYVCAYPTHHGLWWAPRDVTVLDYDPHRDFLGELRAAWLATHPEAAAPVDPVSAPAAASPPTSTGTPAGGAPSGAGGRGTAAVLESAPTLFERVDTVPTLAAAPPDTPGPLSRAPGLGR